jgi:hypothetical protein
VFWSGYALRGAQTVRTIAYGGFSRPFGTIYEGPYYTPLALGTFAGDARVFSLAQGGTGGPLMSLEKHGTPTALPPTFGTAFAGSPLFSMTGALALDDTNVYWCDPKAGAVRRTAKSGLGPTEDVGAGTSPTAIAVDPSGGDIFWLEFGEGGALMRRAKASGPTETVASGLANPSALALDSANVYVTLRGTGSRTGTVLKIARAGGARTVLAENEALPTAVVTDTTAVYWIAQTDNEIRKLPK